jgi:hypothetical protein
MLTLQSVIVILTGWSAIYWQWTDTRVAAIIGFAIAYFVTLAVVAVRELGPNLGPNRRCTWQVRRPRAPTDPPEYRRKTGHIRTSRH